MIPLLPKSAVAAFLLAVAIAALFTPNLRRFAEARGWLDNPNASRKIHSRGVPRLGGLAIVAAFYAPLIGLLLYETDLGKQFYTGSLTGFALLGGGLAIAALGLYDDLRGANAYQKFAVQFAVAGAVCFCGFRIQEVSLPTGTLALGAFAVPLTLIWIVGVINAMNLIDGLDGLAGGVALFAVTTNLVVAVVRGHPIMMLCMAALAGALIGFLFYNFSPASIFLGDTGSLFLGYVLATSSILTHQKSTAAVSLLVPMVALAVPITDTALAMARRVLTGRSMFSGDREHIHHRLLKLGLTHRQVVLVMYAASGVLGTVALALSFAKDSSVAWVLVSLSVVAFWGLRGLGFFHAEPGSMSRLRQRNRQLRTAVNRIARRLRRAATVGDVLESAKEFAPAVAADGIRVELEAASFQVHPDLLATVWRSPAMIAANGRAHDPGTLFLARFDLPQALGKVEVEWIDGRAKLDRDHELAGEALCRYVADALGRVAAEERRRSSRLIWAHRDEVDSWPLAPNRLRRDSDAS